MTWLVLTLLSALFLGLYDLAKKTSVHENAVPPVMLCSCATAAMVWLPLIVWSRITPSFACNALFYVDPIPWESHLLLLAKSVMVGASWTFAFFAMKRLPLTIASPIRATSPFWTVLIAALLLQERPTSLQWTGLLIVLVSFLAFSWVGTLDGIHFHRDAGVAMMLMATWIAVGCSIYDKFLLQPWGFRAATVQAWFSVYQVPVMLPMAIYWYFFQRRESPLHWRWTIPLIAIALLIADYLYFTALGVEGAMISLISPLRRASIVVTFWGGSQFLGERNIRPKAICTAIMVLGIWLLSRS